MFRYTLIFLLFFVFTACQILPDARAEQPLPEPTEHYLKNYNFSRDWFTRNIPLWNKMLHQFKGKPNLNYLEIGVYEGRSVIWMLENILTDPSSKVTGIDTFPKNLKEKYLSNLNISGFSHKATTIEGSSQIELKKLPYNHFDIIYIDGCHDANCVLSDVVLSFELLKNDGLLIFDDYKMREKWLPQELRPTIAIDAFITIYINYLEVVYSGYQLIIKKRESPCGSVSFPLLGCSAVGQYLYFWSWNRKGNMLYHQDGGEPIKLSKKEERIIEKLINSRKLGKTKLILNKKMSKNKVFLKLKNRLKLDFTNIEVE